MPVTGVVGATDPLSTQPAPTETVPTEQSPTDPPPDAAPPSRGRWWRRNLWLIGLAVVLTLLLSLTALALRGSSGIALDPASPAPDRSPWLLQGQRFRTGRRPAQRRH